MDEQNINRSIGRLEGKVDLVIGQMTKLEGAFSTLESGRLSRLETEVAGLIVKMSLIAAGIPIIVSLVIYLAQHYLFK